MATASKRGKNSRKAGSDKAAAKKAATTSSNKAAPVGAKKTAPKKAAPENFATKKKAMNKTAPQKKTQSKNATKQSDADSNAAEPRIYHPSSAAKRDTSPDAQKKLASRHIWELVEAKKRNATKTPAWQSIAHHDHPAPRGGQEQGDQSSAQSTHIEMPGHRDRGTG